MGFVDEVMESAVALIIITVIFLFVLPELAQVTGINVFSTYILGFLMIGLVVLYLWLAILRR